MGKFNNNINILLTRPTMLQYESMSDEDKEVIEFALKEYLKANPVLRVKKLFSVKEVNPIEKSLWDMSWETIILIKKAIQKEEIQKVFKLVYGITDKQFLFLEILNMSSALKWITNELLAIEAAENERLFTKLSDEKKEAGAEELMDYDYYVSLRGMCPNLLEQDKFLKLPYKIIFRELACSKLINDINENYNAIITRKNTIPS